MPILLLFVGRIRLTGRTIDDFETYYDTGELEEVISATVHSGTQFVYFSMSSLNGTTSELRRNSRKASTSSLVST